MLDIPEDIREYAKKYATFVRNGILTVEEIFEAAILAERKGAKKSDNEKMRRMWSDAEDVRQFQDGLINTFHVWGDEQSNEGDIEVN